MIGNGLTFLEVKNIKTFFYTYEGVIHAVDDVSFDLRKGELLGIVGESGSGKSVTALSIMRLISSPGKIITGKIFFNGKDLLTLNEEEMRRYRGNDIAMIFQEPDTSLNPVFTVGYQIMENLILHQKLDKWRAREKAIEMLRLTDIPAAETRISEYPHELSGGMKQRIMIAMALSCNPQLLIADEPTTSLDVTIQAQILELMKKLNKELGTAIILITHDLGVIAEFTSRVAVMYTGKIVEYKTTNSLFENPMHPYTLGLLKCIPKLDTIRDQLEPIPGNVPSPFDIPKGCKFYPRCSVAMPFCKQEEPPLFETKKGEFVRCWLYKTDNYFGNTYF